MTKLVKTTSELHVTPNQHRYIKELSAGPKTTQDLVLSQGVSGNSVRKTIEALRDMKIVESTRLCEGSAYRTYIHRLLQSYEETMENVTFHARPYKGRAEINPEDVLYVAILRNGGFTGQDLAAQFNKVRPVRSASSIKNLVTKARRAGFC